MRRKPKLPISASKIQSSSWNEMSLLEQGRFCMQCQKTVLGAKWSDAAIDNLLHNPLIKTMN